MTAQNSDDGMPRLPDGMAVTLLFGAGLLVVLVYLVFVASVPSQGYLVGGIGAALALVLGYRFTLDIKSMAAMSLFAGLALLMGLLELCKSACGSFAGYAYLAGISVGVLGALWHAFVGIVGTFAASRRLDLGPHAYLLLVPGIGASLLYTLIMLGNGQFCGSCMAAHVIVLVQATMLVRMLYRDQRGVTALLGVCAVAGGINAIYHHESVTVIDEPTELMAYLRSQRSDLKPLVQIANNDHGIDYNEAISEGLSEGVAPLAIPARDLAKHLARMQEAGFDEVDDDSDSGGVESAAPAKRLIRHMGSWGNVSAPAVLRMVVEPMCPACRETVATLPDYADLVDRGDLRIEFDFIYATTPTIDRRSQAAAYLMYAAGIASQDALVETTMRLFAQIAAVGSVSEIAALVDDSPYRDEINQSLAVNREAIEARLTDNFVRVKKETSGVTPHTAIFIRGRDEAILEFSGHRTSDVIVFAIENALNQ